MALVVVMVPMMPVTAAVIEKASLKRQHSE
jgi:hypothetical protein